jgi:hypothetical protein
MLAPTLNSGAAAMPVRMARKAGMILRLVCILVSSSLRSRTESESKNFFFEKKKQKTFACLASAFPERLGPDS